MTRSIDEYEAMARAEISDAPDFTATGRADTRRVSNNSAVVEVRFTADARDRLIAQAEHEDISLSDLIRKASAGYLEAHSS